MADPNSPWQPMDIGTLMQGFQGGGGIPGKTAAARLNYLQDMISTIGNPFKSDPAVAPDPYVNANPSINRSVYGSNPVISSGMDLIDQHTDPVSAFEAVKKANPTDANGQDIWTDPRTGGPSQNAKDVQGALHDYAFEVQKNAQDAQTTNTAIATKNAKNAKAPGIMDVSNAYDLSNQPTVEDLLSQYSRTAAPGTGTATAKPLSYADWVKTIPNRNPDTSSSKLEPSKPAFDPRSASSYNKISPIDVAASTFKGGSSKGVAGNVDLASVPFYKKYVSDLQAKTAADNQAAIKAAPMLVNGNIMDNNNARIAANNWIRNAKATTIHSDAYNKAVQTAVAMRSLMGS